MGLLKSFIFPVLTVVHLGLFSVIYVVPGGKDNFATAMNWPGSDVPPSPAARHLAGAIAFCHAAMAYACIMAFLKENSHFRGVLIVAECILFGGDAYDNFIEEGFDATKAGLLFGLCLVGAVVHMQEPGIFTKDKNKNH